MSLCKKHGQVFEARECPVCVRESNENKPVTEIPKVRLPIQVPVPEGDNNPEVKSLMDDAQRGNEQE